MVPGSSYGVAFSIRHIKDNFYNVKRVWVWQHVCATVRLEALLMTDCACLIPYSVNQRESPSHSTASSSLTSSVLVSKDMPQNVAQNGSC